MIRFGLINGLALWVAASALPLGAANAQTAPATAATSQQTGPTITLKPARQPGTLGGVQLPVSGAYEPQCGGKPPALTFGTVEIDAIKDRSEFIPRANAFNAYLNAYSVWSECVADNMRRDLELVQAAVTAYDAQTLAPLEAQLGSLAASLQKKSSELVAVSTETKP